MPVQIHVLEVSGQFFFRKFGRNHSKNGTPGEQWMNYTLIYVYGQVRQLIHQLLRVVATQEEGGSEQYQWDLLISCPLYSFYFSLFSACPILLSISFHSCCSHAEVLGTILVHELYIFYGNTKCCMVTCSFALMGVIQFRLVNAIQQNTSYMYNNSSDPGCTVGPNNSNCQAVKTFSRDSCTFYIL